MNKYKRVLNGSWRVLTGILCFAALNGAAGGVASVRCVQGNIVYTETAGVVAQLTTSGRDSQALLHPDGEWIYFVRSFAGKMVGEKYTPPYGMKVKEGVLCEEIWRIRKDGTKETRLYRQDHGAIPGPDTAYVVGWIIHLQFSPKGDKVFFETPESATCAGLRVMNADGSRERLLGEGSETRIILSDRSERFSGYIVTSQHRYYPSRGSYDLFFLFTPDLKEIAPIGPDLKSFTENEGVKYQPIGQD